MTELLPELLIVLALLGVPAALVTLIVLASQAAHRRQRPWHSTSLASGPAAAEPVAHHAWTAAHMAHARLARLEARVRQLEALTTTSGGDRR